MKKADKQIVTEVEMLTKQELLKQQTPCISPGVIQWGLLAKGLKNYFSGHELTAGMEQVPSQNKKLVILKLDYYLSLYDLFTFGWGAIGEKFKKEFTPINTPGNALIYVLQQDYAATNINNNDDLKPRQFYRVWRKYKLMADFDFPLQDDWQIKETENFQKLLNRYIKNDKRKLDNNYGSYSFVSVCIELCLKANQPLLNNKVQKVIDSRDSWVDYLGTKTRTL